MNKFIITALDFIVGYVMSAFAGGIFLTLLCVIIIEVGLLPVVGFFFLMACLIYGLVRLVGLDNG